METFENKILDFNWQKIVEEMQEKGFAIISKPLTDQQCSKLINEYNNTNSYRKTVVMERYRFGLSEYKYFNYPLPNLLFKLHHLFKNNLILFVEQLQILG